MENFRAYIQEVRGDVIWFFVIDTEYFQKNVLKDGCWCIEEHALKKHFDCKFLGTKEEFPELFL
jgi:hypothetical protein